MSITEKQHGNKGRKRPDLAKINRKTKRKHGHHGSPTYVVWSMMKQRCLNPSHIFWYRYGGRGIKVSKRWMIFENFIEDMGTRPGINFQIDRIDNNGNYELKNCRWTTRSINCSNRGKLIRLGRKSKTLPEWCALSGLSVGLVRARIKRNWDIKAAIFTAPSKSNRNKFRKG